MLVAADAGNPNSKNPSMVILPLFDQTPKVSAKVWLLIFSLAILTVSVDKKPLLKTSSYGFPFLT